jgi:hypothetical protein
MEVVEQKISLILSLNHAHVGPISHKILVTLSFYKDAAEVQLLKKLVLLVRLYEPHPTVNVSWQNCNFVRIEQAKSYLLLTIPRQIT